VIAATAARSSKTVTGQRITGQFHRLLVKGDQVAGAHQFFDFIRQ
jgi:hypothetical protein